MYDAQWRHGQGIWFCWEGHMLDAYKDIIVAFAKSKCQAFRCGHAALVVMDGKFVIK
jgi:hypothetical protein